MKKFIIRVFVFSVICMIPMGFVFMLADGRTDDFYLRFTVPRQESLILGSSRSAQALQPVYLDSTLQEKWPGIKMFNYSFTRIHSPYGPAYYKSVQKKLDSSTKNGVFILCVDPWVLASRVNTPADTMKFPEDELMLGTTTFVNMNPNVDYLINSYPSSFAEIVQHKITGRSELLVHEDGWLEVSVPMTKDTIAGREERKLGDYGRLIKENTKIMTLRVQYLEKIIEFLKQHGSVYLVRLPVGEKLTALENENFPQLTRIITKVATDHEVPFFDMNSMGLTPQFVDGDHVYKTSGKEVSIRLARLILESQSH